MMVIILTYCLNSSEKPILEFIASPADQVERLASSLLAAHRAGKEIEIYEIEGLNLPVSKLEFEK